MYERKCYSNDTEEEYPDLKFYIEFEPCKDCKSMITKMSKMSDEPEVEEASQKFLRHITYNHNELVQGIIKDFPKEAKKEEFSWFR